MVFDILSSLSIQNSLGTQKWTYWYEKVWIQIGQGIFCVKKTYLYLQGRDMVFDILSSLSIQNSLGTQKKTYWYDKVWILVGQGIFCVKKPYLYHTGIDMVFLTKNVS